MYNVETFNNNGKLIIQLMRWGLVFLILLMGTSFVSAVPAPVNFQGTTYYRVTSTDPTEDTGNEVCAKVGQTCVGYTEPSAAVCQLYHPGASTTSSLSGDRSGVYCNGPPQTNVCSTKTDTCHTCPQCTNSVDCGTPIGGLYREMYVECSGAASTTASCPISTRPANTQALLNQIPQLNSQLQSCSTPLPNGAGFLFGNSNTVVNIAMNNGQTQSFTIVTNKGSVSGVTTGARACRQRVSISQATLDQILNSPNPAASFFNAISNKNLQISGCSLARRILFGFLNPFIGFLGPRIFPSPPTPPLTPAPTPAPIPSTQCYIRGLLYTCYLDSLTLSPSTMPQGGTFNINVKPGSAFTFTGGAIDVVAELEGRSGLGFGVYSLRGTSVNSAKSLNVRTDLGLPKGRYYISVFKEMGTVDEKAESSQILTVN